MIKWFFEDIPDFIAAPGFKTHFDVLSGGRFFKHLWTLTKVERHKMIVYDWRYADYPGKMVVIFELEDLGMATKLILTAEGIESLPDKIPEFSRGNCLQGWEYFIKERLKNYLNL